MFDIKDSIVYNCTPLDITDWIHKSNDFIDCRVTTQTGIDLMTLPLIKDVLKCIQIWSFPYEKLNIYDGHRPKG